jgi:hypothetical protein
LVRDALTPLTAGKWLMALDRIFPFPKVGSPVPAVAKRVLADQVLL